MQVSRPGQLLQARSHVRHHRAVGLELADVLARLGLLEVAHPECPEPPLVPREGVHLVVVAQNCDAQHGSSVSVIIDHAFQVFVDSRDISILGVVRNVEDDGNVLPTLLVDLADDVLQLLFAKVLLAARLLPVRAQLHGARLESMVVHVGLLHELLPDHARLPHLAPAEHHYEADLAARRSAALDQLGQLHRQTRATDVVFRKLVVVGQHHVLGEAGQVGIT
mmetsp:Transcript_102065/g.141950  ORF Transcript_102065/g.141950 Transcript_102065/m.141950 type:complete len:222 (+) Transcript_102065:393-1058(+)